MNTTLKRTALERWTYIRAHKFGCKAVRRFIITANQQSSYKSPGSPSEARMTSIVFIFSKKAQRWNLSRTFAVTGSFGINVLPSPYRTPDRHGPRRWRSHSPFLDMGGWSLGRWVSSVSAPLVRPPVHSRGRDRMLVDFVFLATNQGDEVMRFLSRLRQVAMWTRKRWQHLRYFYATGIRLIWNLCLS